jgi:tetratricopeptide (TPR) repeat protein
MFLRKRRDESSSSVMQQRVKQLVGEALNRPLTPLPEAESTGHEPDVMSLLVELRASAKRRNESTVAHKLGPEFTRYLTEFYSLPAERQPPAIDALLQSRRQEQAGDLAVAVETCEAGLQVCPDYLPLLERLARLETARGNVAPAERWYSRLLVELDRLDYLTNALEHCRRLIQAPIEDPELVELCARRFEASGDSALAARCWYWRAEGLLADDHAAEALPVLDRALGLEPHDARLYLLLALIYERLGEVDRAAIAFENAAALATSDAATLGRVLLLGARASRPDEVRLGQLMDLVQSDPAARAEILRTSDQAVADNPYNAHLRYIQGVLLAQDGQLDAAVATLRIAIDRYSILSDRGSELEARLAVQQLAPRDEDNRRRVAELHFERGEVHLAMKALAGLARVARSDSTD